MGYRAEQGRILAVEDSEAGERLDRWLAGRGLGLSRAQAQRMIEEGLVRVNAGPARKRDLVRAGDEVEILPPPARPRFAESPPIPLDILFEDDVLLVVNKPPAMVVHPARDSDRGTLVHALLAHTDRLSAVGGEDRPGIVHRLDKGTSGLLVVAKTDEAHRDLSRQFKERTVEKLYRALVWGELSAGSGKIAAPLGRHRRNRQKMAVRSDGGREADTAYEVEETMPFVSLVALRPGTGRTHQLRVHLAYVGHPIFGDPDYGGRRVPGRVSAAEREALNRLFNLCPRQALHAAVLCFDHPAGGRRCRFEADLPEDLSAVIAEFRRWPGRSGRGSGGGNLYGE